MKKKLLLIRLLAMILVILCIYTSKAQSISYQSVDFSAGLTFDDDYRVRTQEGNPRGMEFRPDGSRFYVVGTTDQVHQYSLSSAFDVTASVTYNGAFDLSNEDDTPIDITFAPDGLTMYMLGQTNSTVFEYTLSVAFDITSTVTKTSNEFAMGSRALDANALAFSPDGLVLWVATEGSIQHFPLSSAYDISTASTTATNDELDGILGSSVNIFDFQFSEEGTQLYLLIDDPYKIREYELPASFDILSGVTQTAIFDPTNEERTPRAFAISAATNRLHVLGPFGDYVSQYDYNVPSFNEALANDGSIDDAIRTFALDGETFNHAGTALTYGTDFTISNLPTGLNAVIDVSATGKNGVLSFTGQANDHQYSDGVTDLLFDFKDAAFVGGDASAVVGVGATNSGIRINLRDNTGPFLTYDTYASIDNALKQSTTLDVSSQEFAPSGITFSANGMNVFIVGTGNDEVFQYNLTTPFDITSGVTYSGNTHDISDEESSAMGLAFNPNGTKMYLIGASGVNQYSLSVGFDLSSTITFDGSAFDLSSDMSTPQGIAFNPEGSKMYITGNSGGNKIFEYTLNIPYDLTASATLTTSVPINSTLTDIAFDTDGKKLYALTSTAIEVYSLVAPYAIASGLTLDMNYSTGGSSNRGLSFAGNRSGFFTVDQGTDVVAQFDLTVDNFEESFTNDGTIANTKPIRIVDGFFANAGGTLTHGTHFNVTGVPTGLTPVLAISMDGLFANLSFTGNATNHTTSANVDDLIFNFNDAAFNGNTAAEVTNAVNASSHYAVTFAEPTPILYIDEAFNITDQLNLVPNSFDLNTNSDRPFNPVFSNDGTKLFVVDQTNDAIDQYSVTTPFQTTQGMTLQTSFSVNTEEATPTSIQFSADGSKLFVAGVTSRAIHQYSLSTSFDLSGGVTYDNISFETGFTNDFQFSPTGQRLYVLTNTELVQYKVPEAHNLSTIPIPLDTYNIVSLDNFPKSMFMAPNGNRILYVGSGNDEIYQLNLSEAFDISSITFNNEVLDIFSQANSPSGLTFSPIGYQMYVTGNNLDKIRQFDLVLETPFSETNANQGEIEGSLSFGLSGGQFSNAGNTLTYPTDFTMTNLPVGLTPIMTITADGTEAVLTFSGAATNHQNVDDVASFEVTFLDGAFVSVDASSIANAIFNVEAGIDFDNNPQLVYTNGYDLSGDIEWNDRFDNSVNSNQPSAMAFSNDGLTLFVTIENIYEVNQYALTNPFDIIDGVSLTGKMTLETNSLPTGIAFNTTGTKVYIVGNAQDLVYQYALTTPFDITSGTSLESSQSFVSEDNAPGGMAFSAGGDKLYLIGSQNDAVFQYSLLSNFDISGGITYDNVSFSIGGQETFPSDIQFNPDGTKMYVIGFNSDAIHQYNLSTSFDLSSVTYDNISFNVRDEESIPLGFTFGQNGSRLFVCGNSGKEINQYDFAADAFSEIALNNGQIEGAQVIQLYDDNFVNAGGTLDAGTHYTLSGIPAGLSSSVSVDVSGSLATLTLSGQAADHQDADDTALAITFLDDAFENSTASSFPNATSQSIAGIDFNDNNPRLIYGDLYNLDKLSYAGTSPGTFSNEDPSMLGLSFSEDGMTLLTAGVNTGAIYQYAMNTAFDVSAGFTYTGNSYSITAIETDPTSLVFSDDGTIMFVLGSSGSQSRVHQFSLTQAFDISTGVSFVSTFDATAFDQDPTGLTFNADGTKMYIVSDTSDEINQFTLSSPYDLAAGVSFDGNPFSVFTYQTLPTGIVFSPAGFDLFLIGASGFDGRIEHFELEIPFDLTTGVTYIDRFRIRNQETVPSDLTFTSDGSSIIVVGLRGEDLNQYDFSLDSYIEGARNAGSLSGEQTIFAVDHQFVNAGSTLTHGTHFTINNLPSGLTPVLNVNASGNQGVLTFNEAASPNQDAEDVNGLSFTFLDAAFEGGDASAVANATDFTSSFDIDFRDNHPVINYMDAFALGNATLDASSFSTSAQGSPGALSLSADGSKMFTSRDEGNLIDQYSLSTPYDVSTGVTFVGSYSSAEDGTIIEVQFSGDGSRMFVMGQDNASIYQYNLTTAFDVTSGVSYSGNAFSYSDYGNDAYGFAFNAVGTKMFLINDQTNSIHQFSLSSAFDLSSVADDGSPLEILTDGYPSGMAFSEDGRYLLLTEADEDEDEYYVVRYTLNAPFDVTTGGSFDGVFFSLDAAMIVSEGITINSDGSRFYITDSNNESIHQVNMDNGWFTEVAGNDGSVYGSGTLVIFDESFTNAGGSLTIGTDYTVSNLPAGLTPNLAVAADGYSATLSLSGNANLHGSTNSISGLVFTFNNSAFVGGNASGVANTTGHDSQIGIEFSPYTESEITAFIFTEIEGVADIDPGETAVEAVAVAGTDLSAITPLLTLSQNATVSPNSGVQQDFTSDLVYSVTAEDGTLVEWDVSIEEALATPTDIAISMDNFDENLSTNSTVGTLSTTDASFNDTHSYSLISGSGDTDNSSFTISTNDLVANFSGDFETKSVYQIRIQTDDGNGGLFEKAFTITVNNVNESPTDLQLSGLSLNESSPIGSIIGAFTSTDEDAGDSFTYTLVAGTGDTDNASFQISDGDLVSAEVFDFETQNSYSIRIQTEDAGGLTHQETFTIQIIDLPPQVTAIGLAPATVAENEAIGTQVGTFTTSGEDLSGSFTYTLVNGTGDEDNGSFSISGAELLTAESFNFELDASYSIRVKTDDGTGNTLEQELMVTITDVFESTDANILGFTLAEQTGTATIDGTNFIIAIEVERGTSLTALVPTITISNGASVNPASGTSQDFSNSVTYTVTAEDGTTTQNLVVTVTEAPNTESDILTFVLPEQTEEAVIDVGAHTVNIEVANGTDLESLTPTITLSSGATLSPLSGASQDLSSATTYTVTAEDGTTTQDWVVHVTEAPNTATDILTFTLSEQTGSATIDASEHTINIEVTNGTDVAALTPTLTVSSGATVNPTSGASQDFSSAVKYTVTAEDGTTTQDWVVNVTEAPNTATDILTFTFSEQTDVAAIDATEHTINIEVTNGTDVTALTPILTVSSGATVSPTSGTAQDFSSSVTYTVTAEDGNTTQDWVVTVTEAQNTATDILTFTLSEQTEAATIDATDHTVNIEVANGTDVTALKPTLTVSSGATVSPTSGAAQDFSSDVTYTVTAEDGTTTQDWTVSVTEAQNTATDILTFTLSEQTEAATIDAIDHTVNIEVANGTDITALTPTLTVSSGATVNPTSGTAQDFSSSVTYTVIAEDGTTTQDWVVTVTEAQNTATDILTFTLSEQTEAATVDAIDHTVNIEVANGTDVTALTPTLTVSSGATVSPTSGAAQDFSSDVTYTVTAEDGTTTQDWTVSVTEAQNTATDILTFSLFEQTEAATIDATGHTVNIEVANGTDVTALTPTLTVSSGATVSPTSGTEQDFSSSITFTVTAEDGTTTQDWVVTVTEAQNTATDILTFTLSEQTGAATIDATDHTIKIEVVRGTDLTALTPTIEISAGASINPGSGTTQNFSNEVAYLVTAENGATQSWKVNVTVELNSSTDILSFELSEQSGGAIIDTDAHTVEIEVSADSDLVSLSPVITVSEGATIDPANEEPQDFNNPVIYTVTAEDDQTQQEWTVTVTIELALGTGVEVDIQIYPNPVQNRLIVQNIPANSEVQLFSSTGKIVRSTQAKTEMKLDLQNLPAGVYLLKIYDPSTAEIHNNTIIKR